jgi:hypothetical protein
LGAGCEDEAGLGVIVASSPVDGVSGRYFDGMPESWANDQAYDAGARRCLWRLSETLVGME